MPSPLEREFRQDAVNTMKFGARALRAQTPPDPDLTSETMTLKPRWTATLANAQDRWQQVLDRVPNQNPSPVSPVINFTPVRLEVFLQAVRQGSGGAGFDGWSAKELKGLAAACPSLFADILDILNDCVSGSLCHVPHNSSLEQLAVEDCGYQCNSVRGAELDFRKVLDTLMWPLKQPSRRVCLPLS